MRIITTIFFIMLSVWLYMLPVQAMAAPTNNAPIEILADSLLVNQKDRIATFTGKVVATQQGTTLHADTMRVYYSNAEGVDPSTSAMGDISRIEAEGRVRLMTPTEQASGEKGVYDVAKDTLTLTGKVILSRGESRLHGTKLVYNMQNQQSVLSAGRKDGVVTGDDGRVKAIFVPDKKE